MISMLTSMTLTLSLMMIFIKHPLSMGLILLIQSVLITLITGVLNYNFWFSYIMFIIMIGGMLVLFIYMTSIASNEMFKPSMKFTVSMISIMIFLISWNLYINQFKINMMSKILDSSIFDMKSNFLLSLNKFINFPSNMMMLMLIIYLFITLIAVVKITNINYGPLRQKF